MRSCDRAAIVGCDRSNAGVTFRPGVIGLFSRTSIAVTGLAARMVEVRFKGATDAAGLAYERTPYRWRSLRRSRGAWRGVLVAPALPGIYELQMRLDDGRLMSSTDWLLRVFPRRTRAGRSFRKAGAAMRDFVIHLPGDEVLVALRRWAQAPFDHRDPRLHRLVVIGYAPRGTTRPSARLAFFITTIRDGFHGRWRVLEASTGPYD